jgi:hypothetical protein
MVVQIVLGRRASCSLLPIDFDDQQRDMRFISEQIRSSGSVSSFGDTGILEGNDPYPGKNAYNAYNPRPSYKWKSVKWMMPAGAIQDEWEQRSAEKQRQKEHLADLEWQQLAVGDYAQVVGLERDIRCGTVGRVNHFKRIGQYGLCAEIEVFERLGKHSLLQSDCFEVERHYFPVINLRKFVGSVSR